MDTKKRKRNFLVNILGEQYGWVICAVCMIQLFCTSGLNTTGFSVYQPYLIKLSGLTNTESSTLIMIRTCFSLFGLLIATRLIRRLEAKRVIVIGMCLCAGTFFLYGLFSGNALSVAAADAGAQQTAGSPFAGYCLASAVAGFAHGTGGMIPASVVITRWFNTHRGTALGICMSATGLSALVASPIITALVQSMGLRSSFFLEGGFVLIMAGLVWYFGYSNPQCIDAHPIGSTGSHAVSADKVYAAHPASAALVILMMIGLALYGIPGNTMNTHVSVLYSAEKFSASSISLLVAILGGTIALGKLIYGAVADRIGTIPASLIFYVLVVAGGVLCTFAGNGSIPVAIAAVSVLGIGLAVSSVSISIYASGAATGEDYAKTVTWFQLAFNLGSLVFGRVPGMIADRTGSYIPAFQIMAAVGVVSAAMLLLTYSKILRDDRKWKEKDA